MDVRQRNNDRNKNDKNENDRNDIDKNDNDQQILNNPKEEFA